MAQPVKELKEYAYKAEEKYGLPRGLGLAMIEQESSWNPNAVSHVGAIGLTQVMPNNLKAWKIDQRTYANSPTMQIDTGFKFLGDLLKQYGSVPAALAHYNGGGKAAKSVLNAEKNGGVATLKKETAEYIPKIIARAVNYGANISPEFVANTAKNTGYSDLKKLSNLSKFKVERSEIKKAETAQEANPLVMTAQYEAPQAIEAQPLEVSVADAVINDIVDNSASFMPQIESPQEVIAQESNPLTMPNIATIDPLLLRKDKFTQIYNNSDMQDAPSQNVLAAFDLNSGLNMDAGLNDALSSIWESA